MTKFAVLLAAVASLHCASASLWPIPTELTQGESPIWLAPSVSLQYGQGPGSGGRCGPVKFVCVPCTPWIGAEQNTGC